ncbi:hypothetical protein [Methylomonas sp. DH-1]|uniref:DUF7687 domain-containing protein n=1 Tax=Methylomonas sp. (strain DH-1) TaxID=1727196 RepID=UPI0007C99D31|nr:hypothetical protein [Methylomonas sp. DH-1]ANE53948.1 hypothetical protein AYM39_01285 [Methylomonas sp. DH-1]
MKADPRFLTQPKEFWANVRTISQEVGYTQRGAKSIKIPSLKAIRHKFARLGLSTVHIANSDSTLTDFGQRLFDYFTFRATVLNETVQGHFMKKESAEIEFNRLKSQLKPNCPLPMNKQKAEKKNYAFLTGMVNMLVEANIGGSPCDYDPRSLTTMTHDAMPLRTLSRRVDGAFPSVVNPIAIWEIKEYYYTTTFGSRVADGVYETLLDGMELEELEAAAKRKVQHVLFIDDYFTWWECGRSYLCRMIDMLHMGYVDEVVFGREVFTRLPELAREWKTAYDGFEK